MKRKLAHKFIQGGLAGLSAEIIAQQDSLAKIADFLNGPLVLIIL